MINVTYNLTVEQTGTFWKSGKQIQKEKKIPFDNILFNLNMACQSYCTLVGTLLCNVSKIPKIMCLKQWPSYIQEGIGFEF